MQETWVRSLAREDPLEKEMTTHSNTPAWRIPWTEELGKLQSMGSQRVRHNLATKQQLNVNKPQNNLGIHTVHVLTASLGEEETRKPIASYKFTKTY